jgi:hypothetical protein
MTDQRSSLRTTNLAARQAEQRPLGARLEKILDAIDARVASPVRSVALGATLGMLATSGGIAMFLIVWTLLVNVTS